MEIADIMSKEVVVAEYGSTVKEAVSLLVKYHVGCVLVIKAKEAVGIITERDILSKVVEPGKDSKILKVEDIMKHPLITIKPEASVEEASAMMTEHKIKKLPVVKDGNLVGIVTATDIITNEPAHVAALAELVLKPTRVVGG